MLNVAGHACLQDWARLAQLAKQASVAASANRSLRSLMTEPAVAGPNSDRSKAALTRNFIEKSPEDQLPPPYRVCSPLSAPGGHPNPRQVIRPGRPTSAAEAETRQAARAELSRLTETQIIGAQ